jgi:VWFA-related protein
VKLRRKIAALVLLSMPLIAQQAPEPTPGVIRINVNLVQVDAVVTDAKGKPVTDLKADDFEILQDQKTQKIRNFEFVKVKDLLGDMTVRPGALAISGRTAAPPPAAPPRPEQIRRTIALVVDDFGLSYNGIVGVRDSLKKWVNTEMQPGDLVSVSRTWSAMGALQQFTNDKRQLFAAIDRLKYQPGGIGVDSFTAFGPAAEAGEIPMADVGYSGALINAYVTSSLNSIRYVMQGLRDVPGRKSLILFSENLPLTKLDTQRQSIEDRMRAITDEANRSSVVIHAIDPRQVIYTGPTASDRPSGRTGPEMADLIGARSLDYISSQDGMVLMARNTGGLFVAAGNDLSTPLSKLIDDGNGYYLIGYQPEQSTFDTKMEVAKYHAITVRVKRPGLKVRSRNGFYGLSDARPSSATPRTPQAQIAKALVSPFTTGDLRVRLTTLFSNSDKDGAYIKVLLHFDAHDLTFTEAPDGSQSVAVDIALVAFDENGEPTGTMNKNWSLRVAKASFEDVLRKGLVYSVPVPMKKSGPYQLRVALRDATSQKLGSAMQFIEVPDLKKGDLALSGIVLSADPPVRDDPDGNPSLRIFKAGAAFSYAYEIFNARGDKNKAPQLQARIRLYRDGETVFDGSPSPLAGADKDSDRFAVGGRMALTRIPPGDYVMQVIVFDDLRKNRTGQAVQSVDFEVRP